MKAIHYLALFIMMAGCVASGKMLLESKARQRIITLDAESQNSITVLLEMITEQERLTDPSGKHYVPYEFRIPADAKKKRQVHRIDPSISFINRGDTYQCIGDNATKEKVYQVIALPYTRHVKFCPYE